MSIHLESGNLFYDNLNTKESFYDFLLNQQDENKLIIKKKISYYKTFKNYLHYFLKSFDYEEIDKFDLFSDKNAKYLFYKFDAYLEAIHQPKKSIRHTKKVNDTFSLEKNTKCKLIILFDSNKVVLDEQTLYIFENILSN